MILIADSSFIFSTLRSEKYIKVIRMYFGYKEFNLVPCVANEIKKDKYFNEIGKGQFSFIKFIEKEKITKEVKIKEKILLKKYNKLHKGELETIAYSICNDKLKTNKILIDDKEGINACVKSNLKYDSFLFMLNDIYKNKTINIVYLFDWLKILLKEKRFKLENFKKLVFENNNDIYSQFIEFLKKVPNK